MPLTIACPGCRKSYSLPDDLQGKKVRCVQCKQEFTVSATPPPANEDFVEVQLEEPSDSAAALQPRPRKLPSMKTGSGPRRPQPEPQPVGGFLLPLLCICLFFACSIVAAVVGGVALSYLVPIEDAVVVRNNAPPPPWEGERRPPDAFPNPPPVPPPFERPQPLEPPPPPPRPPEPELRPAQVPLLKELPAPRNGGAALLTRAGQVKDVKFTGITLPGTLPCMCWSADATRFFALDSRGILRRVTLKDFQEEKVLELGQQTSWLSQSAEGLLVTLPDAREVWIVDPDSMAVKKRWVIPPARGVVSAPKLATAFAHTTQDSLIVLDLKTGQTREYQQPDLPNGGFRNITPSPDGKYLFAQGGGEVLIRYRVEGTKVSIDDRSERIAQNGQSVCVSPDSAFVCLPSGGGNYGIPGRPNTPYSTYVYRTTDLRRPVFTLASGAYPRQVGFDPKAGLVYAQNADHPLIVFTATGVKQQEYQFDVNRVDPIQFLVHPDGKKLLVHTGFTIYWAELGAAPPIPMPPVPMPPFPPNPAPTPEPRATKDILAGENRKVNDADVTTVRVNARELLEGMCWAADGKSFYCGERSGAVRRVAANGLKEQGRLDVGRSCHNLALSSEGLVVAVQENAGEVWLLDPESLRVKRKIAVTGLVRVMAAQSGALAYAVTGSPTIGGEQVSVIDLKTGKVLSIISKPAGEPGLGRAVVTPDGKYLFGYTNGTLHRFRIAKEQLTFEESAPKPNGPRPPSIVPISTDGRFVCLPAPTIGADRRMVSVPIYSVTDLQKPAVTLESTIGLPMAVGFAPNGKTFYGSTRDGTLTAFGDDGQVKKKYALETSGLRFARQIVVHSDGSKVLVATTSNLYWVELPK